MNDIFKKRRCIRKYLDKPIEDEKIHQILCAGMVAPSGMNTKGYEFVVVKNKDTLLKLASTGKYVNNIAGATAAIVIMAKEYTFWIEDCSLAAGYILLEAVNQGISGYWADIKDGILFDKIDREVKVRKILGIPDDKRILCVIALGYPDEQKPDHSENEYDEKKVHFEKY